MLHFVHAFSFLALQGVLQNIMNKATLDEYNMIYSRDIDSLYVLMTLKHISLEHTFERNSTSNLN